MKQTDDEESPSISAEYLIEHIAQRVVELLASAQMLNQHDVDMIRSHVLPKDEGVKAYGLAEYKRGFADGQATLDLPIPYGLSEEGEN